MYRQIDNPGYWSGRGVSASGDAIVAQPGQLDALMALERIGTRVSFARNDEIYAEGGGAGVWYKVVSGTVRICKLLADGRRHIAEFCFSGDCFGIDITSERRYRRRQWMTSSSCVISAAPPNSWSIAIPPWPGCCATPCCANSPP